MNLNLHEKKEWHGKASSEIGLRKDLLRTLLLGYTLVFASPEKHNLL